MTARQTIPWEKIFDVLMECGCVREPDRFIATVLEEIGSLASYDQALAYCLDENRRVCTEHLINIKSRWSTIYLNYFSQLESNNRTLQTSVDELYGMPFVMQIDWSTEPMTEFLTSYIMARGIRYSLSFVLFDLNSLPRVAFSLDRTRAERFSESEIAAVRMAVAHLGNLYKNFLVSPDEVPGQQQRALDSAAMATLTRREREIVELLIRGFSPAHIAEALFISTSTVYKHIAHIYKKLGVSSQQELFVRLLGPARR